MGEGAAGDDPSSTGVTTGTVRRLRDDATLVRLAEDHRTFFIAVVSVGLVASWLTRWMVDDAYISFRYSKNLATGHGLVFNPGERVEGYTNFLWTVLHALPEALGINALGFSHLAGMACYAGAVVLAYELARRLFRDEVMAIVVLVLVAWNGSLIRFATSGMETCLQLLLVLGAVVALVEPDGSWTVQPRRLATASAVGGLALLTRLDSAVLLVVWFGAYVVARRKNLLHRPARLAALVAPGVAVVLPWLIWKQAYYGALLPNTFVAKTGGVRWQMLLVGLLYLVVFALSYGLVVLAARVRRLRPALAELPLGTPVLLSLGLWALYVVWVGGDWMEFRFMVAVVPFLAIVTAVLLDSFTSWIRQAVVLVVLAGFSLLHLVPSPVGFGVFSPESMDHGARELMVVGRELQQRLPGDLDDPDRPLLAVGAAGALAYFSDLRSIDLLGLTDSTVARTGEQADVYVPGHQIIAPVDYLVGRKVNLVLVMDGPIEVDPDRTAYRLSELVNYYPIVDLHDLPTAATVVEIPSGIGAVRAIYLTPHPEIERLVEAGEWRQYPIERVCRDADIEDYVRTFGTRTCPV